MPRVVRVRGSVIATSVAFVRDRYGPEADRRVCEVLTPRARRTFGFTARPPRWVPLAHLAEYMERSQELLAPEDGTFFREMGRHGARHEVEHTHYALMAGDRETAVRTAEAIWSSFVDEGRVEVAFTSGGSLSIRILWKSGRQSVCERLAGGLGVYFGARDVEHPRCVGRGDPDCEFALSWPA